MMKQSLIGGFLLFLLVIITPTQAQNPRLPTPKSVRVTGTTLSWKAVANASGYELRWRSGGGIWMRATLPASQTRFTIHNLTANVYYAVQVRALAARGSAFRHSSWSRPLALRRRVNATATPTPTVTPLPTPSPTATPTPPPRDLPAPSNLRLLRSDREAGTATIAWRGINRASGYRLRWRPLGGHWRVRGLPASPTWYTLTNLARDTSHQVQVRALGDGVVNEARGPWSKSLTLRLLPLPTGTLTSTTSQTPTPILTPSNTSTPTPTATHTPTNTATHTPTDTLTSTATYTPIPILTTTSTHTPTPTPTNSPTPSPTFTPTPTFTPSNTPTPTPTATQTPTNTATHTPTNTPTPTSTFTPSPTFTPLPPPPAAPMYLNTYSFTTTEITLYWQLSPDASHYEVRGGNLTVWTDAGAFSGVVGQYTFRGLSADTEYSLSVRALNAGGASSPASIRGRTAPLPTATPTFTPSNTPTPSPTFTPSHTPTFTPTHTPSPTATFTPTHTPTPTFTPTYTPTPTFTPTLTPTPTFTPTATPSPTAIIEQQSKMEKKTEWCLREGREADCTFSRECRYSCQRALPGASCERISGTVTCGDWQIAHVEYRNPPPTNTPRPQPTERSALVYPDIQYRTYSIGTSCVLEERTCTKVCWRDRPDICWNHGRNCGDWKFITADLPLHTCT